MHGSYGYLILTSSECKEPSMASPGLRVSLCLSDLSLGSLGEREKPAAEITLVTSGIYR